MRKMLQKTPKKVTSSRSKHGTNGTKNVREQNSFQIEQKILAIKIASN